VTRSLPAPQLAGRYHPPKARGRRCARRTFYLGWICLRCLVEDADDLLLDVIDIYRTREEAEWDLLSEHASLESPGPGLRRCCVRCLTGAVHRASAAVPHPPSLDALTRQDVSGGRLSSRRPAGTDSPPTKLPRANTQQSITRLHQYHDPSRVWSRSTEGPEYGGQDSRD
jgi:hypothetical protein